MTHTKTQVICLLKSSLKYLSTVFTLIDSKNLSRTRTLRLCFFVVCQHWRDVAIATPQLWVDLQIRLRIVSQSPQLHNNNLIQPEELGFIDNWVAHSRPHPPSLYIAKYRIQFKREIPENFTNFFISRIFVRPPQSGHHDL